MPYSTYTCLSPATDIGVPIVLLNGWSMSHSVLHELVPFLQHYASVIVVDVIYDQNIEATCDAIVKPLPEKYVLLGWSLGGMLATKIAADYPDAVLGLITLATNARFVVDNSWSDAMSQDTFELFCHDYKTQPLDTLKKFSALMIMGDQFSREQRRYLSSITTDNMESIDTIPSHWLEGLALLGSIDNTSVLQQLCCPSCHIFGEKDKLLPASAVEAIQALLSVSCNRANCHVITGAAHFLVNAIERITPILDSFFKSLRS